MEINRLVVFATFLLPVCLLSQSQKPAFQTGTILLDKSYYISAEYQEGEDSVFLRNESIGKILPKERIEAIVTQEYFRKIQETSRLKATMETFYLLSSGREYHWQGEKNDSYEEILTRSFKIGLILTTAYFYTSANRSNNELGNSFLGFGSERAESRFQREYNNYKIAGGLTAFVFGASAIHAYFRFGRSSQYHDLQIKERELLQLEGISKAPLQFPEATFGITINY